MMLKNFRNYCKYSGIWLTLIANPYHWVFAFRIGDPHELQPKINSLLISFGPIVLRAVLDDGSW